MGFLRSTKGSIISDYFQLQEDIAGFSKGYMYDVALYDDHLEITSMQKRKLLLNYNQITDVFYGGKTELIQKPKSVIGRAVVGMVGMLRAVSIGLWITVLVVVLGMSGVAWYIFQHVILLLIPLQSKHGSRKWQLKM